MQLLFVRVHDLQVKHCLAYFLFEVVVFHNSRIHFLFVSPLFSSDQTLKLESLWSISRLFPIFCVFSDFSFSRIRSPRTNAPPVVASSVLNIESSCDSSTTSLVHSVPKPRVKPQLPPKNPEPPRVLLKNNAALKVSMGDVKRFTTYPSIKMFKL